MSSELDVFEMLNKINQTFQILESLKDNPFLNLHKLSGDREINSQSSSSDEHSPEPLDPPQQSPSQTEMKNLRTFAESEAPIADNSINFYQESMANDSLQSQEVAAFELTNQKQPDQQQAIRSSVQTTNRNHAFQQTNFHEPEQKRIRYARNRR